MISIKKLAKIVINWVINKLSIIKNKYFYEDDLLTNEIVLDVPHLDWHIIFSRIKSIERVKKIIKNRIPLNTSKIQIIIQSSEDYKITLYSGLYYSDSKTNFFKKIDENYQNWMDLYSDDGLRYFEVRVILIKDQKEDWRFIKEKIINEQKI